jgi:hypothetical protein
LYKRMFFSIIALTFVLSNPSIPSLAIAVQGGDELTIYTEQAGYSLSKLEPETGIYLGAYVLQDMFINQDMNVFNEMTQKRHASFFKYVGYGQPFPKRWVDDVKAVGAVPHIAFEPNNGLDEIEDDRYLRTFARDAHASGVPIFLRFASEMNGTWTAYSGESRKFIKKWKLVHDVMEAEAPEVAMVWTVFTFPEASIKQYYPGDLYVDWVGVNIYNVMYHNNSIRQKADKEDPLKLLDYVYNSFSHKKPIQISEYGATHYSATDNRYHVDFAKNKIARLYEFLPSKYPRVKSIFYFDVNNVLNAPEGRKINDYSITNNDDILNTYAAAVQNPRYLTNVTNSEGKRIRQILTYRGNLFRGASGTLYVDQSYFRNVLGLKVAVNGNQVTLSDCNKSVTYRITYKKLPRGFYGMSYMCLGLPLQNLVEQFGYRVHYDGSENSFYVKKKKSA